MNACIIPVSQFEEQNAWYTRQVQTAMEEVLYRLEDALRQRLVSCLFSLKGDWTSTRFNKDHRRLQPMKVDVAVGMEVSVLVDLGTVEGDYEEGVEFYPRTIEEKDIERIVDTVLHELRILDTF